MRKNNGDKSKARRACTNVSIRGRRVGKGLVNQARRTVLSQAGTSPDGTGCFTGRTVKAIEERGRHCRGYKHYLWVVKTTVFNLILRMQAVVCMLISTCILSMMESTPMVLNKEQRPSKYTAQLFDCGISGKIQLLQIPETCDEGSKEGEMAPLRETYVLSRRKLKKTSGVSCCASVSKFRGYCGTYSHWKCQQTPIIKKSIP